MSVNKQGVWEHNTYHENELCTYNHFNSFTNGTSTATYSSNQYTINSPIRDSTWGSNITITNDAKVKVPYGCIYRIMLDVNVPVAHNIQIDINNRTENGTNWGSNDNDLTSTRTATNFSIPANTWTTITWGSSNTHGSNTNKEDIYVYDSIGLVNSSDSGATTWYIRNPRIYLGNNLYQNASISNDSIRTSQFYEV